ncbi:DUF4440 domain-containing protein [Bacillus sp. DJP31]|uniref:nuclear transport factor 2 family protein n=1 Tax=Bacillus sp. DJP31 TaxID=3409789 RepID=UPI003BB76A1D
MKTLDETLKEHICTLEKLLLQPDIRSNLEELNRLLADEFFEYGSSGTVWYKTDCTINGGLSIRKMSLYDFELHTLSEGVVLATYKVNDETRKQLTLRSSIWKFIDGRWQMFFHQGTVTRA